MSTKSKTNRLFRPSLGKFTKGIEAVWVYSKQWDDGSWVWPVTKAQVGDEAAVLPEEHNSKEITSSIDFLPMGLCLAPEKVKSNGIAYAYWSLLLSAVIFQNKNVEPFIKRIAAWWGDSEFPINPFPESDIGWEALFGDKDQWFEARIDIFKEICTSDTLKLIANSWVAKIKDARVFNLFDAANLARAFPKSFADPFLFKAQRAIWLFTWPYKYKNNLKVIAELTPPSLPWLLNLPYFVEGVEVHSVLSEKLKNGGFLRDEASEKAVRAFIVLNGAKVMAIKDYDAAYNFVDAPILNQTTDY